MDIYQVSISIFFQVLPFKEPALAVFLDELDQGPHLQIQVRTGTDLEDGLEGDRVDGQVVLIGEEFGKGPQHPAHAVARNHHPEKGLMLLVFYAHGKCSTALFDGRMKAAPLWPALAIPMIRDPVPEAFFHGLTPRLKAPVVHLPFIFRQGHESQPIKDHAPGGNGIFTGAPGTPLHEPVLDRLSCKMAHHLLAGLVAHPDYAVAVHVHDLDTDCIQTFPKTVRQDFCQAMPDARSEILVQGFPVPAPGKNVGPFFQFPEMAASSGCRTGAEPLLKACFGVVGHDGDPRPAVPWGRKQGQAVPVELDPAQIKA